MTGTISTTWWHTRSEEFTILKEGDLASYRIVDHPAFTVAGRTTRIDGPDNEQSERYWQQCKTWETA